MKTQKPYVTIILPGSSEETVIAEFATYEEARKHANKYTKETWIETDVMKRLDDSSLTCEF